MMSGLLAVVLAVLSAMALYAGSRHCRWTSWRRVGRAGRWGGALLAIASWVVWMRVLGAGAGSCAMLGTWMLAMMALPYMAGIRIGGDVRSDG
ncbi:putative membrane protein [Pseudoxanthomonas japonensis]|jgi:hypothetical protein|uniref:hypothetical protein n=1 Tax=Pseudoxanthomonas TaxID=83618 RepID=UPI000784035B|nr:MULTISPECIES: hypothetical protein [Pseudoxanthomonas]MBA3930506.1 hypothetical protein [Xanthomonas sp.]MBL8255527.1 hypothetical protein [Pseudoxanthomonas mexicana]MDR7067236.1 putative membrane protein [Pseudoxanthomonas japonensis]